jgi:tetratricopeptide (TPR) repeat protein
VGRKWVVALVVTAAFVGGCATTRSQVIDPLSAEEHNDLGVAYFLRGDLAPAAREFERALILRPDYVRALVNLGDTRLALGAVDGAIAAYEQARSQNPDDPPIANNLAWALLQHHRRWPEAEPIIRAALARHPEPRGYYLDTLGALLLKQQKWADALDAFHGALADPGLQDPPVRAMVLRHAGQAWRGLGNEAAAARCDKAAAGAEAARSPSADPAARKVGGDDTVC